MTLRYAFAHRYLRDAIFQVGVWDVLFGTGGAEYLRGMWDRCAEQFPECEPVSPDGLGLGATDREQDWELLPITFPPPEKGLEAYLGAIAIRRGRKRLLWREAPTIRYFVLERLLEETGLSGKAAVLGEWTPVAHRNCGFAPIMGLADFVTRVRQLINEEAAGAPPATKPRPRA